MRGRSALRPLLVATALLCGGAFVLARAPWSVELAALAVAGVGAAVAALVRGRARAILAALVGVGGTVVWALFPPAPVLAPFGDLLFAAVPALLLVPMGLVDRARRPAADLGALAATAGIVALVAVWVVPVKGAGLAWKIARALDDTRDLAWFETAYVLWFMAVPAIAALGLFAWRRAPSPGLLVAVAAFFVLWLPVVQVLYDLMVVVTVMGWRALVRTHALLVPLQLTAFAALAALAPTEIVREDR